MPPTTRSTACLNILGSHNSAGITASPSLALSTLCRRADPWHHPSGRKEAEPDQLEDHPPYGLCALESPTWSRKRFSCGPTLATVVRSMNSGRHGFRLWKGLPVFFRSRLLKVVYSCLQLSVVVKFRSHIGILSHPGLTLAGRKWTLCAWAETTVTKGESTPTRANIALLEFCGRTDLPRGPTHSRQRCPIRYSVSSIRTLARYTSITVPGVGCPGTG